MRRLTTPAFAFARWPDRGADDVQLLVAPPERPRPEARAGRPPLVHRPSVGNRGSRSRGPQRVRVCLDGHAIRRLAAAWSDHERQSK